MPTVSVFPPAANIVWSDARGAYGIADTELIYWPARSGLHLVTHDDDAVPVRSATYPEARLLQAYREAQRRYCAGGGYQSSLRGAEKDLRRMLLDLSGGGTDAA